MKDLLKAYASVLLLILTLLAMTQCARAGSQLIWDANPPAEMVTSYNVYAAQGTGAFQFIGNTATNKFDLPALAPGAYQFTVSAKNEFGESIQAVPVQAYMGTPSQPKQLKLTVTISVP